MKPSVTEMECFAIPGTELRPSRIGLGTWAIGGWMRAVERLDAFARARFGKRALHLAIRWLLDQPGVGAALWGARRPDQLDPVADILGFHLDASAMSAIDAILRDEVGEGPGPEFMAPPRAA